MSNTYIVTEQQRQLDLEMVPYDIWGTRAHVAMLRKIGVLDLRELEQVVAALDTIEAKMHNDRYQIDPSLGAQLTLEKEITEIVGKEIGGKVPTGRSRNDQVITAQRLYLRDKLLEVERALLQLVQSLVESAGNHIHTIMPGYTHMQPAKPTTFGQWCLAYADMFLRDVDRIEQTFQRYNSNPLGAAESYGTSWPLDRELTANLLGFDSVQEIPLDVVGSRGEMEAEILSDLAFIGLHLSKTAQDLLVLSTFEFGMVELSQEIAERMDKVTGSSIMPQKKNPDVLELVRANASVVYSLLLQALEVLKALPFGYNRDSRETKEAVVMALRRSVDSLAQMQSVISTLLINKERMRQAVLDNYSLATDLADYLASQFGLPYRIAYTIVGNVVDQAIRERKKLSEVDASTIGAMAQRFGTPIELTQEQLERALDPEECIEKRQHIGGASLGQMTSLIDRRRKFIQDHEERITMWERKIKQAKRTTGRVVLDFASPESREYLGDFF